MELEVLNIEGKATGKSIELPNEIFGVEPNEHAVWLAVKAHLANKRQGTHKAKERGEIKGSTRKIKRQKGTGTARAGSIKSPIFRGGGRIFGPKPRSYSQKLNTKVKRLARKSALSSMAVAGKIKVVQDFNFDAPKTKSFVNLLASLEVSNMKTLVVTPEYQPTVFLSGRNVPNAEVAIASDLYTYQIMKADTVIISESGVQHIVASFG